MAENSVKGAMLMNSVVMLRRLKQGADQVAIDPAKPLSESARLLRELGRKLGPAVFEKELSSETLALLDEQIVTTSWYPMRCFNEIQLFFWNHISNRDPEKIRVAGADSFHSMNKTGRYQQLEFAEREESAKSKKALLSHARMITSVIASYYNFLHVEVQLDAGSEDLQIIYTNATDFCEPLRYSTEGFMNAIQEIRKSRPRWTSARESTDRIVFTLPRAAD